MRGCVLKTDITDPASWRATRRFDQWLKARGIVGIAGIDTRALTALIREKGMPNGIVAHAPDGVFDVEALKREAAALPSMAGLDLVPGRHHRPELRLGRDDLAARRGLRPTRAASRAFHVVAIDYGIKRNILRLLADQGCR